MNILLENRKLHPETINKTQKKVFPPTGHMIRASGLVSVTHLERRVRSIYDLSNQGWEMDPGATHSAPLTFSHFNFGIPFWKMDMQIYLVSDVTSGTFGGEVNWVGMSMSLETATSMDLGPFGTLSTKETKHQNHECSGDLMNSPPPLVPTADGETFMGALWNWSRHLQAVAVSLSEVEDAR